MDDFSELEDELLNERDGKKKPLFNDSLSVIEIRRRAAFGRDYDLDLHAHKAQRIALMTCDADFDCYKEIFAIFCADEKLTLRYPERQLQAIAKFRKMKIEKICDELREYFVIELKKLRGESIEDDLSEEIVDGNVHILQRRKIIDADVDKSRKHLVDLTKELLKPKTVSLIKNRDIADNVAAHLHQIAPWLDEVTQQVWRDMLSCVGGAVHLRPILLVGPSGCGKTYYASRLAKMLDMPFSRIEIASATSVFDISGCEYSWSSSTPGEPISLIERSGSASGLIILDELDKSVSRTKNGGDPILALLPLLQRDTAKTFRSPFLQCPVDLSYLNWIATANSLRSIPRPVIDRFKVIHVNLPAGRHLYELVKRQLGNDADDDEIKLIAEEIKGGRMSLRRLEIIASDLQEISNSPMLH